MSSTNARLAALALLEFIARQVTLGLNSCWLPSAWGLWSWSYLLLSSTLTSAAFRATALWGLFSSLTTTAHPLLVALSWTLAVALARFCTYQLRLPGLALMASAAFVLSAMLKLTYWSLIALTGELPNRFAIELVGSALTKSILPLALCDALSSCLALAASCLVTWNFASARKSS